MRPPPSPGDKTPPGARRTRRGGGYCTYKRPDEDQQESTMAVPASWELKEAWEVVLGLSSTSWNKIVCYSFIKIYIKIISLWPSDAAFGGGFDKLAFFKKKCCDCQCIN